jgi:hypothetical protein
MKFHGASTNRWIREMLSCLYLRGRGVHFADYLKELGTDISLGNLLEHSINLLNGNFLSITEACGNLLEMF